MSLPEQLVSCEIMSTAICPLNCSYCYIPKSEGLNKVHQRISENIKSGKIFDDIYNLYGDRLQNLGFWGAESTLTIPLITEKIPLILERFPKLQQFDYSTSGITNQNIVINFVKAVNDNLKGDRKVLIQHQISIDGEPWLTDKNRMVGAVEIIEKNLYYLLGELNKLPLKDGLTFRVVYKSTIDVENMKVFLKNPVLIGRYDEFFKRITANCKKIIGDKRNFFIAPSTAPTLAVPGKYTAEDGKTFGYFLKRWHSFNLETAYEGRLMRPLMFSGSVHKRRQFTCSGSDANLGLEDYIHICHRTFFMNDENYVNSILEGQSSIGDADNWDVSLYNRGVIELVKDNFIVDPKNESEVTRFLYTMRGYHAFTRFGTSYIRAMLEELVAVGQADKELIEDDGLFLMFAQFLMNAHSCPMENALNTGSIHLTPLSLIRLWGNGAFQELLRWCVYESTRRK